MEAEAAAAAAAEDRQELSYAPLSAEHVPSVRVLLGALLPVRLHDQMYRDAVACEDVSQLAFYCPPPPPPPPPPPVAGFGEQQQQQQQQRQQPELVGALLARLEAAPGGTGRLYIAALAVAAPFRRRGIASELLRRALAAVANDPGVFEAYLHARVSAAGAAAAAAAGAASQRPGPGAAASSATAGAAGAGQSGGGGDAGDGDNDGDDGDDGDDEHAAVQRWYGAREFAPAGVVEGYYARLPPPCDALVMRRPLSSKP